MSLPTKYTGLILASGEQVKDPTFNILETLAPFKISILDSTLLTVRDRFVLSLLIELNPDHREAISEDLDLLTKSGAVDVAYDFKALPWPLKVESSLLVRCVAKEFSSEALFETSKALSNVGAILRYSLRTISDLVLLEISVSSEASQNQTIQDLLAPIGERFALSYVVVDPSKEIIGGDCVLFDMDSTFINEEVIDIIAEIAGVGSEVSDITDRAMRGELNFAQALKERVALLEGSPASILEEAKSRITLTLGASEFVEAIRNRAGSIGVVSGGFHDVIDSILEPLQLDLVKANRFEIIDGFFSGQLLGEIVDREAKEQTRREFSQGYSRSIAVGDGANDIAMIQGADIGIAFMAKDALRKVADLSIRTRDLRAILPLIGY